MAIIEKNILTAEDILSADDIAIEKMPVPEWGGYVFVKTLTGEERDQIEAAVVKVDPRTGRPIEAKMEKLRALVAFYGLCDETGKRLFTDQKQIDALGKKSAAALDRVVAKIQALAAMSPADIETLTAGLKNVQPAALPSD